MTYPSESERGQFVLPCGFDGSTRWPTPKNKAEERNFGRTRRLLPMSQAERERALEPPSCEGKAIAVVGRP
jgi:hypothetical protein